MAQSNVLDFSQTGEAANIFDVYKRTQRQLLRSPTVLTTALQRDTVAHLPLVMQQADPLDWLQGIVNITFPDEAEIMNLSVRCEEPRTAEALADAIVQVYLDDVVYAEREEKLNRIASLQKAETETEASLRRKRSELRRLADTLGTGDSEALTLAQRNTLQEYSALWSQLNQVEFDLRRARHIQSSTDGAAGVADLEFPISNAEVEIAAATDLKIVASQAQLDHFHAQIAEARRTMFGTAQTEYLARYREAITREQKRVDDQKLVLKKELAFRKMNSALAVGASADVLEAQRKDLSGKVSTLRKEAEKFGRSSIDVELMRAEIKALDDLRDRVQRELHAANIEIASLKSRVAKLSAATTPQNEDRNRRLKMGAGAGGFGFFAGCALIVFWDLRRRRLNTLQDVGESLRLPVLGTLPLMRASARRNNSEAVFAEAIDGIVTRLVFTPDLGSQQVVLVTSASAGEGKSTVALNLAKGLAEIGRKTVLVDFDLRRPTMHQLFGVELSPGIGDLLSGIVDPLDAVHPSSVENLFVLSAGAWSNRGLSGRHDEPIRRIIGELREAFEQVIIDAGPVLAVVDTRIVARYADGVMISLLRDVTEIPKVEEACELLRSFDIRILGVVMIGAPGEVYYSRSFAAVGEPS
jgi:capsular exopolysaccharide synthesis family protein